MSNKWQE